MAEINDRFKRILEMNNRSQLSEIKTEIVASYGVQSGLLVEAQGTPDMTVKVSAGVVYMPTTFTRYAIDAVSSIAITTADATNPRWDIIYVSAAGVITYLAGTAAASPSVPATPSGGVKLAEIYVAAGDTAIGSTEITLRRTFLENGAWSTWAPTLTWTTANPTAPATVAKYKVIGKTLYYQIKITSTDGKNATGLTATLPIVPKNNGLTPHGFITMQINNSYSGSKYVIVRDNGTNNDLVFYTGTMNTGQPLAIYVNGFYEID